MDRPLQASTLIRAMGGGFAIELFPYTDILCSMVDSMCRMSADHVLIHGEYDSRT